MRKKDLLREYNRLNKERISLIDTNESLTRLYSDTINSRAVKIARIIFELKKKFSLSRKQETIFTAQTYLSGEYQNNQSFNLDTDIKALAFYLPQFHSFPENDRWWGKDFTEWTNTKKAKPRFNGHYQPREPHDNFGYYTLTNKEILEKQIKLAKEHKLYGFCFYYYWFSGKRLMEKPVDILLKNKDLNFPFCLCWANENWTRCWDGKNKDILIKQEYSVDDRANFIKDLKPYLTDNRYIRVNGKPIILIYNPRKIPKLKQTVQAWREVAKDIGIGEIEIWTSRDLEDDSLLNSDFVDAEFHFSPHGIPLSILHEEEESRVADYSDLVDRLCNRYHSYDNHFSLKPFYYSSMMAWDNSPRRSTGYLSFANYSPELFYRWTRDIIRKTRKSNPQTNVLFL